MQAYEKVSPVVAEAANTAAPYVKSAAKTATDLASPALKALQPVVQVRPSRRKLQLLTTWYCRWLLSLLASSAPLQMYPLSRVQRLPRLADKDRFPCSVADSSFMQSGVSQVESFLSAQGLNSQAIVSNARDAQFKVDGALTTAKPTVNSAYQTITATSPTILAEYALGLVAFYYLVLPSP